MDYHWHNGSLREQLWANHTLPLPEANKVDLIRFLDGRASLVFFPTPAQSFHPTFALVNTLLSSDFYSTTVECVYPVSGTYSFSSRLLFYVLLLLALWWRRHGWLAVAALATAMTYSATTAVHAFALVSQFGWTSGSLNLKSSQPFGDLDIYAVYAVLTASLVMLMPILSWSTSVRSDKAQIIVVLWGILALMAWTPVIVYLGVTPSGKELHPWGLNPITSLLMCPWSATQKFPSCGPEMGFTAEDYDTCQCFDFCGVLGSPAPMRSGTKMVAHLNSGSLKVVGREGTPFWGITYYSQVMAVTIVVYGAFGLILHQFSLREIRGLIFQVCDAHPREHEAIWIRVLICKLQNLCRIPNRETKVITYNTETTRSLARMTQYWFAKSLAITFYSLGLLLAFICPVVFVTVITVIELSMVDTPMSERNDAVGSWSPWVGAIFVLLVAVILRLQAAWECALMSFSENLLSSIGLDEFKIRIHTKELRQGGNVWHRVTRSLLFHFWSAADHARYCTHTAISTTLFTCQEFRQWITSPIPHPYTCGCEGCVVRRKLDQAARILEHQVDQSTCQSCMSMENGVVDIFRTHAETGKECGCRACGFSRQQALDTTMRKKTEKVQQAQEETKDRRRKQFQRTNGIELGLEGTNILEQSKDYKTLGVRILQMFASGIDDKLSEPDSTHNLN